MSSQETLHHDLPHKVKGQNQPFIDENLQLQLPDQNSRSFSYRSIYSHYSNRTEAQQQTQNAPSAQQQLDTFLEEAKQVYSDWKKLQNNLLDKIRKTSKKN